VIYTLAGGARGHENNYGFSLSLLGQKAGVGVEKVNIMGGKPSVEEGMAKMPNIHMCLDSRICKRQNRWRNQVLFGHFLNVKCSFHTFANVIELPEP
jgi:hypothetical protein